MLCFLDIAKNGINMNLIAFRRPTHVYQPDSCPFGLGGYLDKGFAWRFEMPEDLLFLGIEQPLGVHCLHDFSVG
jgi:hypothetical protein